MKLTQTQTPAFTLELNEHELRQLYKLFGSIGGDSGAAIYISQGVNLSGIRTLTDSIYNAMSPYTEL